MPLCVRVQEYAVEYVVSPYLKRTIVLGLELMDSLVFTEFFRCLTGERNILGQRFFYQIVSSRRINCPRTTIPSSDYKCIAGEQIVLGQRFFHQIVSNRRTNCRRTTIHSFIRLCLASELFVLGQRFIHQIVSSRRTNCRRTTIIQSDCV
ncbi:uncharacterized protein [Atheta coriaria]|uniref:uncharacterized protein n=1 Tax=Dalotia coriaria TaxID=877792 RepID=UPI0031F3656E